MLVKRIEFLDVNICIHWDYTFLSFRPVLTLMLAGT
jgi:hypothetical protein